MLELFPFLVTNLGLGVVFFIVLLVSMIIFAIPVLATRGKAQVMWIGVVGFLITAELAVMVTLSVMNQQGNLWN